jgi:hypothetical protein
MTVPVIFPVVEICAVTLPGTAREQTKPRRYIRMGEPRIDLEREGTKKDMSHLILCA